VKTLLECGAKLTVVSLDFTDQLLSLVQKGDITIKKKPYHPEDLEGMFLVIGATNDEHLNIQISSEARKFNVLCNIVDRPEMCDFILPSIINKGDLIIAISTSGKSPAFAKKLRKELEKEFGEEYAAFLHLMGEIRNKLLCKNHAPEAHKQLFNQIIDTEILEMIRDQRTDEIDGLLQKIFGKGYIYAELIKR
jgi:precorrin-2 dehydrogenase/sirohydrochlorin ferrochelatase